MARVLCIEDEPDFREDIVEYLRLHAYEVDEAADGAAALAMLREQDYDLVICDIMMPGMDGFSVLKEHRSHLADQPAMSDVPFVFLKRGTLIKNIRLTYNEDEIECNAEKVKGLVLRTEFLKKA